MKFLADENCDFSVVRALRQAGHDVLAIAEEASAIEDSEVIKLSFSEKRILLTEDKDFGQLVHAYGQKAHAVVLVRYPVSLRKSLPRDIVRLAKLHGRKLTGCFVVVEPGRIRFSRPPF
jgi:predicted nuclease of predicted toxin-antitoxin system